MSGPERGFRLDIQLSFQEAMAPHEARAGLVPWSLDAELYGGAEVRGARLSGELDPGTLLTLLGAGFEGGLLRAAELGRRGVLRGEGGRLQWMPWRRNVVLGRGDLAGLELADGVRYVLE